MVTAWVEMDLTLGDDTEIANWICVLVATWGDGTLFSPTSFREDNVIELCIELCTQCAAAFRHWDDGHIMSLCCSHGLVPWACQVLYKASHSYTGKGLHCCQGLLPLWLSGACPGPGGGVSTSPQQAPPRKWAQAGTDSGYLGPWHWSTMGGTWGSPHWR